MTQSDLPDRSAGTYEPAGTYDPAGAYEPSMPPAPVEGTEPQDPEAFRPARPAPGFNDKGHVKRTRISGVWIGLIGTALFLILLLIFIAQNSRSVPVHFLGWQGHFSLALAIIASAVIGILLVAIPGSIRIVQLRRALRKNVPDGRVSG
ncbi:LapA family protein [Jatrophihabitans telluris]|uniref:LapA family protein n=1 Tax=Jatrophihabitans telluris TaxID=2038343 RepID=A0ABY4R0U7_9ACTN|nr:LapA family protein [Jatrophihabitans telluris]UQX89092.1 LapA family protein [Jatrophihabitans telluris]